MTVLNNLVIDCVLNVCMYEYSVIVLSECMCKCGISKTPSLLLIVLCRVTTISYVYELYLARIVLSIV